MKHFTWSLSKTIIGGLCLSFLQLGCEKGADSFSTLAASDNFNQSAALVNNKIDILWVVDNSGSMDSLQTNLVNNFTSFVSSFQAKGFDFQIAVTTSDAYLAGPNFKNDNGRSMLKDGGLINGVSKHSGYPIITNATPDIPGTFLINAVQGSGGSGDERAFSSIVETLNNPSNSKFHRPGAFLAVIVLSDEDDFSDKIGVAKVSSRPEGGGSDHDYANAGLMTSDELLGFLDTLTSSKPESRTYNVSAISVIDSACYTNHVKVSTSSVLGTRYKDLVNKANGILGSVCDASYASSLNFIQQRIVELATQFRLSRLPVADSIKVFSNGVAVAKDSQNGWSYDSNANAVIFHGTSVPSASSSIKINFDPAGVKN